MRAISCAHTAPQAHGSPRGAPPPAPVMPQGPYTAGLRHLPLWAPPRQGLAGSSLSVDLCCPERPPWLLWPPHAPTSASVTRPCPPSSALSLPSGTRWPLFCPPCGYLPATSKGEGLASGPHRAPSAGVSRRSTRLSSRQMSLLPVGDRPRGGGWGLSPTKEKDVKMGKLAPLTLPAPVQSQPCPWNCPYKFRLFQNPAADCSNGSQLLSGNSSGRSPLNTEKLRCNQPGWNSGKSWLWGLRKKEHVSGPGEVALPAQACSPSTCQARPHPPVPVPPSQQEATGLQPGCDPALLPGLDPATRGRERPMMATPFCSLASACHLSVVVSKAKHEPGFSIMVAILACNFIT